MTRIDEFFGIAALGNFNRTRVAYNPVASGLTRAGRALASAERNYRTEAERARIRSYAGSAFAVLLTLIAFSIALLRAVRSRRRAEGLAAENARLLAASRVEATTDSLTGLPNRRKLMDDGERDIASASTDAPLTLVMFDLDGFKSYNDTFGHPAGDALLARLGATLSLALAGSATGYRMGGDEFCVLASTDDVAALVARARAALFEEGEWFSITASAGTCLVPSEASTLSHALQLADQRLYAQKRSGRSSVVTQTRDALIQVLTEQDPALRSHVSKVAVLAAATAAELGLDAEDVLRVRLAAELHDIGKAAIPETILTKPGPLDDAEWDFVKRHPLIGARILAAAPALANVAPLVRSSHERIDGAGYPDGLAGEDIPLGARVVAVADAFDAMITDRPYRDALPEAEAIAELRRCAGSQFDSRVVAAFIAILDRELGRSARAAA